MNINFINESSEVSKKAFDSLKEHQKKDTKMIREIIFESKSTSIIYIHPRRELKNVRNKNIENK